MSRAPLILLHLTTTRKIVKLGWCVLCTITLSACVGFFDKTIEIPILVAQGANQNRALAVDFVFRNKTEETKLLDSLHSQEWFSKRDFLQQSLSDQLRVFSVELLPGASMEISIPRRAYKRAESALVFAAYAQSTGDHKIEIIDFAAPKVHLGEHTMSVTEVDDNSISENQPIKPAAANKARLLASDADVAAIETRICNPTSESVLVANYQRIAKQFNRLLANRYPFTNAQVGPQAAPSDIIEFFSEFDHYAGGMLCGFSDSQNKRYAKARQFINQLMPVSDFFKHLLAQDQSGVKGVVLEVNFTPGAEIAYQEILTNIIREQLTAGKNSVNFSAGPSRLRFEPGTPVSFAVQLANSSAYVPVYTPSHSRYVVSQTRIEWREGGFWALLNFLQKYQASPGQEAMIETGDPDWIKLLFPLSLAIKEKAESRQTESVQTESEQIDMHIPVAIKLFTNSDNTEPVVITPPRDFPAEAPGL